MILKNLLTKFSQKQKTFSNLLEKGFTMIEMLVVIGIFGVLTAVVMFNYGNFNSQAIMTNMAYEVALAARQAQVYSLGVRGQRGLDNFENRYGIFVSKTLDGGNGPGKNFVFFIDKTDDETIEGTNGICGSEEGECYTCPAGGECLEQYTLTRDIYIDRICVSGKNEPYTDELGACDAEVDSVAITFKRPNPDGIIVNAETPDLENPYNSVGIILKTRYGDQRAVVIKSTGQISVENLADASS